MDANIIAPIASAVGVLVGVYAITNRTEDRLSRRIDTLESHINQRFTDMSALFTEKLLRVEQVMDARIKHLEEKAP